MENKADPRNHRALTGSAEQGQMGTQVARSPAILPRRHAVGRAGRVLGAATVLLTIELGTANAADENEGVDTIDLAWEAPAGCPPQVEMRRRIRERVAGKHDVTLRVRGRVTKAEAIGVRVVLTTQRGERILTAPTCDEAAEAVTVILALAAVEGDAQLASEDAREREADARTNAEARHALSPNPGPNETERDSAPAKDGERSWNVSLGGVVDSASLPEPSFGPRLGIETRKGALSFGFDAAFFLPTTRQNTESASTTVQLVEGIVSTCLVTPLSFAPIDVGGCLGAGLGVLPAQSEGVVRPRSSAGVRLEGVAAARVRFHFGNRAALRLEGGPLADPVRPSFQVGGLGETYRSPPVSMRGALSLEVRIP